MARTQLLTRGRRQESGKALGGTEGTDYKSESREEKRPGKSSLETDGRMWC